MITVVPEEPYRKPRVSWRHLAPLFCIIVVILIGSSTSLCKARPVGSPKRFRATPGLNAVFGRSGQPVNWVFQARGSISSSPLVVGDTVYLTSNGRRVYSLKLDNGALIWKYRALSEVMTQPLLAGSTLIIATGNAKVVAYRPTHEVILGVGINEIVGLSVHTGNSVWSLGLAGTGMPTGIIVGGTFYHIDGSGELLAVRAESGRYLWRENVMSTAFMTSINYDNGIFYTAGNWPNRVIAFNSKGRLVWSHKFSAKFSGFSDGPLAISNGLVYGVYMENTPSERYVSDLQPAIEHVYALSLRTGRLRWDTKVAKGIVPPYNMSSIPLASHNSIIVGSPVSPFVSSINARTGKLMWKLKVGGPVKNGPVELDGIIYFGDLHGDLFAVNEITGEPIGCVHMNDGFNVGSAVISRGSLIIGSLSGKVYALPLARIRTSHECTASLTNIP